MPPDPDAACLHDIFLAVARRHPDRTAIEVPADGARAEASRVTYAALAARASALAAALGPYARPDERVAILLPREGAALYVAQLGTLIAGGAFTGLDVAFPDAHIRRLLADARPVAVVTNEAGRARLTAGGGAGDEGDDGAVGWTGPIVLLEADGTPAPPAPSAPQPPGGPPAAPPAPLPSMPPAAMPAAPSAAPSPAPTVDPSNLAYVVYTSGTTGEPKGVMIEHRGIVHLVRSDVAAFGLTPDDRVAQGSSPAYDSSIEETWLAFAAGATLVVLDDATARSGPDLVDWLRERRITVFCPPPTLLRMTGCADPAAALPELALLYVGGEALEADLADRWSRGRRMVNGYGPTECTVTVVRGDVAPGRPVTIGRAVEGNRAHVLAVGDGDDGPAEAVALGDDPPWAAVHASPKTSAAGDRAQDAGDDEVGPGESGELAISGPALARGYLGQAARTNERFVHHPRFGRIYRTGDRVRREPGGELTYLGRLDEQVKVRGYRIELGAVEAALAAQPGVRAAAAAVQGDGAAALLVAYVVPQRAGAPPETGRLAAALGAALPDHMVPRRFGILDALPTTAGGKLDRRALPPIDGPGADGPAADPPADAAERRVAAAFATGLGRTGAGAAASIDRHADFFLSLGGTSLSAVAAVLALRDMPGDDAPMALPSVRDLYDAPTAAGLAARLRAAAPATVGAAATSPSAASLPSTGAAASETVGAANADSAAASPALFTALQIGWLAAHLWIGGAAAYGLVFVAGPWWFARLGLTAGVLALPLAGGALRLAALPLAIGWAAAVKRAAVGRYAPGRHALWGAFHLRHWLAVRGARAIPWTLIAGTELSPVALRALGARVGRRVHIHRGVDVAAGGWDVLSLGDDVTLAQDCAVRAVEFEAGAIVVGAVTLGAGATLEVRAGVAPGASIGRGGQLTALSHLAAGAALPAGERWDGVPARSVGPALDAPTAPAGRSLGPYGHALCTVALRSLAPVLAAMPAFALVAGLLRIRGLSDADVAAWLAAPTMDAAGAALIVLAAGALSALGLVAGLCARALLMRAAGRVRPGVVDRLSIDHARVQFKTGLLDAAGTWLSGSMLWPIWLRAAGMRVGRGAEISTIIDCVPERVSIGAGSFFADGVYLAGPRIDRGAVVVADTRLGSDTFLGNHAVVPAGGAYPDGLFVGVATAADAALAAPGTAWFGHPPMALPRRDVVAADRRWTHAPDALRWSTRAFWECLRIVLPAWPTTVALGWAVALAFATARAGAWAAATVAAPLATLAGAALLVGSVVALKWALLGRVRPGQHAFWSCWCGRWDFLYMAWGIWARAALAPLEGTLVLNAVLRAFGMRIGRRVVLGRGFTQVVDPDMLRFGDDAVVVGQFQAHTFEDRILKIGPVHLGPRATVGTNAVLFYGADVGAAASVGAHSVVMKGDVLEAGRRYDGCPTRPSSAPPAAPILPTGSP